MPIEACGPWVHLNAGNPASSKFPPPGETVLLAWQAEHSVEYGIGMWLNGTWSNDGVTDNSDTIHDPELPYPTHWARIDPPPADQDW